MLHKRLTKASNSCALILDKPRMDLAGISAQEEVAVSTMGHGLVVAPASEGVRDFATAVPWAYGISGALSPLRQRPRTSGTPAGAIYSILRQRS